MCRQTYKRFIIKLHYSKNNSYGIAHRPSPLAENFVGFIQELLLAPEVSTRSEQFSIEHFFFLQGRTVWLTAELNTF